MSKRYGESRIQIVTTAISALNDRQLFRYIYLSSRLVRLDCSWELENIFSLNQTLVTCQLRSSQPFLLPCAPGRKALTLLLIFQFYSQCLFHSSDLIYNCWMIEPHCLPQGWELANELAVRGAISFRVCRSGQFCIILNKKALQVHICLSCLFICFSCFWLFLGLKWLSECPSYSKK